ncbi:peptidase inhibitor family I36 protein [Streptomyces sp. H27-H5]|uniref:peptidase inhibitor family I36 protein n=1 Tax=Streptomyces sp. H27-H5 TaxID=2996460 RepID=UPI00226FB0F0|nr:peptidase inhibitor family I36 protein [Streptomyces sp. H27-H5]MCY0960927.1 peptidase inhibitor family I36 protein [Streptomyces sp. H27-H5]
MTAPVEPATRRAGRWGARARAGVTGAACLVLALALAPAAQAGSGLAAPAERCTPGWVCGWTGPVYTGVVSLVAQDMPQYPETTAYVGFNDGTSVWNGSGTRRADGVLRGRCVTVYNKAGYEGRSLTIGPGKGVERLPASFGHIHSGRFHDCRVS